MLYVSALAGEMRDDAQEPPLLSIRCLVKIEKLYTGG